MTRMIKKIIKGLCIYLNGLPWVKPVAILTAIVILSVFVASFITGRDIGRNATELGIWFGNGIFWAALGKSYFEGRDKGRGDKDGFDPTEEYRDSSAGNNSGDTGNKDSNIRLG